MAGTTTELALLTAVDTDDTADYLTLNLANSLRTIDALFNNVTGHTHASAHQGGPIAASSVRGPMDIVDWFRSTGHTTAYAGTGIGIELFWNGTQGVLQGRNAATAAFAPVVIYGSTITLGINGGNSLVIAADQSVTMATNVTVGGWLIASSNLTVNANLAVGGTTNLTGTLTCNAISGTTISASSNLGVSGVATVNGAMSIGGGLNVNSGVLYFAANNDTYIVRAAADQLRLSSTVFIGAGSDTYLQRDGTGNFVHYAASGFRWARSGFTTDTTIGTLTNGSPAFVFAQAAYVNTGYGFCVGTNDLHGQSFYVAGGAGGPTGWQTISSLRWKSNVVSISDALVIVTNPAVHGYHFDLAPPETTEIVQQYGFVGEEWLTVAPDVVNTDSEGQVAFMDYGQITPIIYEALKEYIARTDARLAAAGIP